MAKLRKLTFDETGQFQLDEADNLYWRGSKLTDIKTFAIVIMLAAVASAFASVGVLVVEIGRSAGWWG